MGWGEIRTCERYRSGKEMEGCEIWTTEKKGKEEEEEKGKSMEEEEKKTEGFEEGKNERRESGEGERYG